VKLKVIIEPGEQSGFVIHVPALLGCWSQGPTREEALANVREAVEGWIEAQQDRADRSEPTSQFDLITV
jgi:predicted RNase H-like HicB family nuclease